MNVLLVSRYGERLVIAVGLFNAVGEAAGRGRQWALRAQEQWTPVGAGSI